MLDDIQYNESCLFMLLSNIIGRCSLMTIKDNNNKEVQFVFNEACRL